MGERREGREDGEIMCVPYHPGDGVGERDIVSRVTSLEIILVLLVTRSLLCVRDAETRIVEHAQYLAAPHVATNPRQIRQVWDTDLRGRIFTSVIRPGCLFAASGGRLLTHSASTAG